MAKIDGKNYQSDYNFDKGPIENKIVFYTKEIFKRYFTSKNIPLSFEEQLEIEQTKKNLSLILWIGKSHILSKEEEESLLPEITNLNTFFHQNEIYEKTNEIIQKAKNITKKIVIIEDFIDIEHKACIYEKGPKINQEILHRKFNDIISNLKNIHDNFTIMKTQRKIHEIKNSYFENITNTEKLEKELDKINQELIYQ